MNPGIGAPELLVLVILALVVVGPKDLPLMVRRIGRFMGKMRGLARDFQNSFDELGREAELAELRKEIDDLKKANPVNEVRQEFQKAEQDAMRGDAEARPHPRSPGKGAPLKGEPLTDFEAIEPVKHGAADEFGAPGAAVEPASEPAPETAPETGDDSRSSQAEGADDAAPARKSG